MATPRSVDRPRAIFIDDEDAYLSLFQGEGSLWDDSIDSSSSSHGPPLMSSWQHPQSFSHVSHQPSIQKTNNYPLRDQGPPSPLSQCKLTTATSLLSVPSNGLLMSADRSDHQAKLRRSHSTSSSSNSSINSMDTIESFVYASRNIQHWPTPPSSPRHPLDSVLHNGSPTQVSDYIRPPYDLTQHARLRCRSAVQSIPIPPCILQHIPRCRQILHHLFHQSLIC